MAYEIQVAIDCADPASLAAFWAECLHYVVQPPPEGYPDWPAFLTAIGMPEDLWDSRSACVDPDGKGPRLYFQKVPEGKAVKNRLHLDVRVPDVEAEVARLTALGARRVEEHTIGAEHWVVMADPEGNEFCLS